MFTPIPILLYHSISSQAAPKFARWTVAPGLFESHMSYLKENGFHSYTVTEFVSGFRDGSFNPILKPVLITFDDGFADFYTNALPVLNQYGMKATIYIVTKFIGATSRWLHQEEESSREMMTWNQVRSLRDHGIECGAHSHTHPQLDILPSSFAQEEIRHSKRLLEDKLGIPVNSFAYPHGYYNQSVKYMVEKAGYTSACAVKHAMSSIDDDCYALARLIISPDTDLDSFRLLLEGDNLRVAPYPEPVRTKAWRGMRWLSARLNSRSLF